MAAVGGCRHGKNEGLMILDQTDTMAREKIKRNPNEPKRHKPASMTVRKQPAPEPKYLVTFWWDEVLNKNRRKVRPNPNYKA